MEKWFLILIVACLFFSICLFRKAAGTLNPGKINIVSGVFYLFMLQSFLGISLIMLGLDRHYTLDRLINREAAISKTFIVIMLVAVAFPLCMVIIQKLLKFVPSEEYKRYLVKETEVKNDASAFIVLCIAGAVCILLMLLWFSKIGYIPFFRLLSAPEGFNFSLARQRISSTYLWHPYVSNILVLAAIPLLSYCAFAYFLVKRDKKWGILFFLLLGSSILTKTYDFAKSPVVYYLAVFLVIYIYYKGKIRLFHMMLVGVGMSALLVFMYWMTGFKGTLLDIYNGPIGRTLFSQLGALLCVFDAFPSIFNFIGGRSLSGPLLPIIGLSQDMHLRSGRLMMDFYGSEGVYDGTAGVLNSFFVGEAYANYGMCGILFAIIWISLLITVLFKVIIKLKKTPVMIAFMATMTLKIAATTQSGFFDFIFSVDWIFTTILFIGLYILVDSKNSRCLELVQRVYLGIVERNKK
ncbi:oligosaccharide repeat unit polymerase [Extibacter muris]|uniref:oligosaccharide repeat unit polymerase n=1 Tax=Extibacter muris TaxID=1796622 RepID=UPI001D09231C|nr:oligosaccharide repeat unit polymerase [Extibacter muris]MCB6203671.1 oligosaccharide repeat unit polymerase [Extibacter muris]MCQ4665225.1 oligosaccharide repeat unit polymerase [Extibacter muris]MCQ4694639.1 oligosaccharide repeat unit polymerase [Extibacter muris]